MAMIVVASDAPSVRREICSVVDGPGTEVVEVASGPEVMAMVHDDPADLVIVDMQMGNMGAMAVCLDLRLEESMSRIDRIPVLMLLDRRPDVFLARRSGAEGWLVKPLDPLRIRRATNALLAGGTFHDESFQPVPVAMEPGRGTAGALPTASTAR